MRVVKRKATAKKLDERSFDRINRRVFAKVAKPHDPVDNPTHYTVHPSGVECIAVTEHFNFCVGNAIKYLWRADTHAAGRLLSLKKAAWYVAREIAREEARK